MLLNLKPSGAHYMEHFHHAGGLPALMRELTPFLDTLCAQISGGTIGDVIAEAEQVPGQDVIRTPRRAVKKRRRDGGAARQPGAAHLRSSSNPLRHRT